MSEEISLDEAVKIVGEYLEQDWKNLRLDLREAMKAVLSEAQKPEQPIVGLLYYPVGSSTDENGNLRSNREVSEELCEKMMTDLRRYGVSGLAVPRMHPFETLENEPWRVTLVTPNGHEEFVLVQ